MSLSQANMVMIDLDKCINISWTQLHRHFSDNRKTVGGVLVL